MFTFDLDWIQTLTFLVAVVSPLLVGLVTKRITASGTKAWLLAGIAALTGYGSEALRAIQDGTTYDLGSGLVSAITAFLIAVGLHYGIYKPTGVSAKAQNVGSDSKVIDAPINGV